MFLNLTDCNFLNIGDFTKKEIDGLDGCFRNMSTTVTFSDEVYVKSKKEDTNNKCGQTDLASIHTRLYLFNTISSLRHWWLGSTTGWCVIS